MDTIHNPSPRFFAHSAALADGSPAPLDHWEPLETHLIEVSETAAAFADAFGAREWAALAGLWHDLGKYSQEFQNYLMRMSAPSDPHREDVSVAGGRVDHSTAGAQHSHRRGHLGHLLAYVIAGHHTGLPDGVELGERLRKTIPIWEPFAPAELKAHPLPSSLPLTKTTEPSPAGTLRCAMFVRMIFSSLVDADFLRTEAFMSPEASRFRPKWPEDLLQRMEDALQTYLDEFGPPASAVDAQRNQVRAACEAAANLRPGFFDLTVPTGGGKTLSSLLFALRHARQHGLRRVIYAIPFTSIIEQNADVFRSVFKSLSETIGQDIVLEHHSNLILDKETTRNRVAAENWDAPLVVGTGDVFSERKREEAGEEARGRKTTPF